MTEKLVPARFGPGGHFIGLSETQLPVRLHDGIVLHLIAESDGGEIVLQNIGDGRILTILPVGKRHAQLDARLRGKFLQLILVIIHHRNRRVRIRLGVRGDGRVRRCDRLRFLLAGQGGGQHQGQQDMDGQSFHFHTEWNQRPKIQKYSSNLIHRTAIRKHSIQNRYILLYL